MITVSLFLFRSESRSSNNSLIDRMYSIYFEVICPLGPKKVRAKPTDMYSAAVHH